MCARFQHTQGNNNYHISGRVISHVNKIGARIRTITDVGDRPPGSTCISQRQCSNHSSFRPIHMTCACLRGRHGPRTTPTYFPNKPSTGMVCGHSTQRLDLEAVSLRTEVRQNTHGTHSIWTTLGRVRLLTLHTDNAQFENNPPMCQQQHTGFILPTHCQQCLHKRACYTRETLKVLAYLICCKLSGNIPRQHGVMYTENCPLVRVHQ